MPSSTATLFSSVSCLLRTNGLHTVQQIHWKDSIQKNALKSSTLHSRTPAGNS